MAELSDFMGHILEEITRALVRADIEAIRTARMYVSGEDGLLKNFAIPRMRLPNIEITAPLVITDVPEGYVEKTDPDLLSQSVAIDVKEILATKKININITEIIKIIKEDEFLSKGYLNETSVDTLSIKIGDRVKRTERKTTNSADVHKRVVSLIREQLIKTFNMLPRKPLGIGINPKTSVIKEFNQAAGQGGANVLYLKMSVTEEALEIDFKDPSEPVPADQPKTKPIIKRLSPE